MMQKIKDLVEIKTGKLNSNAAVENGKYPFFTCDPTTLTIDNYSFDEEAVLLAGNNASGNFTAKYYKGKFDAYQRTYVITSKDKNTLDIKFFCYALNMQLEGLKQRSSGSTTKFLTLGMLHQLEIPAISIEKQQRIASILSAYDDLIENNKKQIKLLEEAAQRLYKEWFVDLRFPGHENVPVVDGVPEGWEVCKLADVADINARSISKSYSFSYLDYVELSSVNAGRITERTRYEIQDAPGRAKRIAKHGDIIWGMVRPNLRAYALVMNPLETDIFSTGFSVLSAKDVPFTYLYCLVTRNSFVDYLVNCTNGAAYPAVKPVHFEQAVLVKPTKDLLVRFHSIVEPMFVKIHTLEKESRNLSEARDFLLPKLMNGEIEV